MITFKLLEVYTHFKTQFLCICLHNIKYYLIIHTRKLSENKFYISLPPINSYNPWLLQSSISKFEVFSVCFLLFCVILMLYVWTLSYFFLLSKCITLCLCINFIIIHRLHHHIMKDKQANMENKNNPRDFTWWWLHVQSIN